MVQQKADGQKLDYQKIKESDPKSLEFEFRYNLQALQDAAVQVYEAWQKVKAVRKAFNLTPELNLPEIYAELAHEVKIKNRCAEVRRLVLQDAAEMEAYNEALIEASNMHLPKKW